MFRNSIYDFQQGRRSSQSNNSTNNSLDNMQQPAHTHAWKLECSILYFVGFVLLGGVISGLGPFIPFKAAATGLVETAFGVVFTSRGVGYVLGSLSAGKIQQKYAAHRIMSCSFLIIAVTAFLAVSAEEVFSMCVIFFFSGLGCSGIEVISQASLVEVHEDKVDPWMQFLHFCFGVGAFLSPLFVAWFGGKSYIIFGVVSFALMVVCFIFDSPKIHKQKAGATTQKDLAPLPEGLANILAAAFCIYVGFEVGYGGWISTYGTFTGIATHEQAAYCSSIFWGCISIGRILAVPFAVRFATNLQLKTLIIGCICSMVLSIFLIWVGSPRTVIFICSGLYGFAMSAIYPLLMSMPGFLKYKLSAKNTSLFVVSGAIGESLVPLLIGFGISHLGPNTLYWSSFFYSCGIFALYYKIMTFQQSQASSPLQISLVEKKYEATIDD